MLLNLRVVEIYSGFYSYLPIGGLIGLLFLLELIYLIFFDFEKNTLLLIGQDKNILVVNRWVEVYNYKSNLSLLGELLYNFYIHFFLIAAFILLVAMIGSIVLTLDHPSFPEENFEKKKYFILKSYEKRRYKN